MTPTAVPAPHHAPEPKADSSVTVPAPRLAESNARTDYFERIVRGELGTVVIVFGQSGSGKTTLSRSLESGGISPALRYIPRPLRPDDVAQDQPWRFNYEVNGIGKAVDLSGSSTIFFANNKYAGYYGFRSKELIAQVKDTLGASLIIGRAVEIAPILEGARSLLPLAPVAVIGMDVPLEILESRLNTRISSRPEEREERARELQEIDCEDRRQFDALSSLYGLHLIPNVAPGEHPNFNGNSRRENLAEVARPALDAARERARTTAQDILTPRAFVTGLPTIPDGLVHAVEQYLVPAIESRESTPLILIKSGLAAALYLGDRGRRVSNDIDFTTVIGQGQFNEVREVMQHVSRAVDGKDAQPFKWVSKGPYHTHGCNLQFVMNGKERVEFDAFDVTNVHVPGSPFEFELFIDGLVAFQRRSAVLPSGNCLGIVPPEQLVVEKLLAGRGADEGKFDLFDAAGILATMPFDFSLLRKAVFEQRIVDQLDDLSFTKELGWQNGRAPLAQALRSAGITTPALVEAVLSTSNVMINSGWVDNRSFERPYLARDVKRLAMLDRMYQSAEKILSLTKFEWQITPDHKVSLETLFGAENVERGATSIMTFCRYVAEFELARHNTFVRKPVGGLDERERFFDHLDDQRRRLSR